MATSLYDFDAVSIAGQPANFSAQRGKVVLIVNTASACGFTPQFGGLEKLWNDYRERGLVIVGFPSNEFGGQDPGSNDEIGAFCQKNYGVSFPMMSKVDVNGGNAQLVPQRSWEFLAFVERPILGDGLVRLEAGYNRISLVQDRVPTPEGFDAPGKGRKGR